MRAPNQRETWLVGGLVGALALTLALTTVLTALTTPRPPTGGPTTSPDPPATGAWVTSPTDRRRRLAPVGRADAPATASIAVDPADRRQVWRGVGATMTDASVAMMGAAPETSRLLFDPAAREGAHLDLVRLPLTSTDMSAEAWTWGWDGTRASPHPHATAAASLVARLARLRPDLSVVATPWTAPVWMKDSGSVRGGALREDEQDSYAAMLLSQAGWLRAHGVPLDALSLGNEPGWSADYPSMTMTDEQLDAVGRRVASDLHEHGVGLWAVDHNWSDRPRYDAVLGREPGTFDAAAYHCYGGEPEQMAGSPVPPVLTECTGTTDTWPSTFAWDAEHLLDRAVRAGSTGLMMWNLATDASGGPRDLASQDGCERCRGLVTVRPGSTGTGRVTPGPEFYTLAHLARAADPGARVLGSSATPGLWSAAFRDPDGTLGVVVQNDTGHDQVVAVRVPGRRPLRYAVGAGELLTARRPW